MTRLLAAALLFVLPVAAQEPPPQTQEDDYTRYELLSPDMQQFAIVYDVTATTPGARFYDNPIRKGSVATDERVIDLMSGEPLKFDLVDDRYIRVHLPRPVPQNGEVRLRIWKTYRDPKTYFREGDTIVFDRSLGIRRNAVVLPAGYEVVSCNVPSQVLTEEDGRVKVSFMNPGPGPAPLVLKARKGSVPDPFSGRLQERAFQDREIFYFLQQPETHAFSLYHDYTETRAGVDRYLNIVRPGSTVSNPSAFALDTGEPLEAVTLKGPAIAAAAIDIGEAVTPQSEVVVIRFPPVKRGGSLRLRISETYTDPARYRLEGGLLVWDRAFGRPRNTVVLPEGWALVDSSIPATVTEMPDGRIRLYFENNRPDEIATLIRARRR